MKAHTALALAVVATLLTVSCASQEGHPVKFSCDGCSASPDGPLSDRTRWTRACNVHDYRYWRGGTPGERRQADRELRDNIAAAGNPLLAQLYLLGVRLGGSAWFPTPYRWGYAWAWPRGYGHLSEQEKAALDALQDAPPPLNPPGE